MVPWLAVSLVLAQERFEFVLSLPSTAVAIACNGAIAVGREDGTVTVYASSQKASSATSFATIHERGPILALSFSPDGQILATGFQDDGRNVTAAIWQRNGKLIRYFDALEGAPVDPGAFNRGFALKSTSRFAWSPKGALLAAEHHGHLDTGVRVWDLHGQLKAELGISPTGWKGIPINERGAMAAGVKGLAFSPDGKSILTSMDDGYVRTWRLNGRVRWQTKVARQDGVCDAAYSLDGNHVVFGTSWQDRLFGSLDASNGRIEWESKLPICPMAVSTLRDGRMLVVSGTHVQVGHRVPLHDLAPPFTSPKIFAIDLGRRIILVSGDGKTYDALTHINGPNMR